MVRDDPSCRIVHRGLRFGRCIGSNILNLLITSVQARVQHEEFGKVAVSDAAVQDGCVACWQPLVAGLFGDGFAGLPRAFAGLVVLGTVGVGVIGRLVIVPHMQHRHLLMQATQVGIKTVLRVARAVINKLDKLLIGIVHASEALADLSAERRRIGIVFVDVVAQVQYGIQIVTVGDLAIGIEVAGRVVAARDDGEACLIDRARRGRPRAACQRMASTGREPIVVDRSGLQVLHVDLDCIVTLGARRHLSLTYDLLQGRVTGNAPFHRHGSRRHRRHPRPQHHGRGQWITTRHAMIEGGKERIELGDAARRADGLIAGGARTPLAEHVVTVVLGANADAEGNQRHRQQQEHADVHGLTLWNHSMVCTVHGMRRRIETARSIGEHA